MVLSPSGRGVARLTSPTGLLADDDIDDDDDDDVVIVVVVVVVVIVAVAVAVAVVVAVAVAVAVIVSVDDGDSRFLEFASLDDVSTFCGRRKDGLLRKELDNGVRGMVRGAIRDVGDVPATDAIVITPDCDAGGGGGGGGTVGTDAVTCTRGNRGGGNGRL
jgi:hypothetical protein